MNPLQLSTSICRALIHEKRQQHSTRDKIPCCCSKSGGGYIIVGGRDEPGIVLTKLYTLAPNAFNNETHKVHALQKDLHTIVPTPYLNYTLTVCTTSSQYYPQ